MSEEGPPALPAVSFRYRRPGKGTIVYRELLVLDRPDVKVLLLERHEGPAVRIGGDVVLDVGAPIVWYVFPDRWYDVGRFHRATGVVTGWYTNFSTPVRIGEDGWSATDLFLDHWLPPSGAPRWLDEAELAEAVRSGLIDRATERRLANERAMLDLQVGRGEWPPPIARDVGLEQVHALREAAAGR